MAAQLYHGGVNVGKRRLSSGKHPLAPDIKHTCVHSLGRYVCRGYGSLGSTTT